MNTIYFDLCDAKVDVNVIIVVQQRAISLNHHLNNKEPLAYTII
jgi:hypothetical protein